MLCHSLVNKMNSQVWFLISITQQWRGWHRRASMSSKPTRALFWGFAHALNFTSLSFPISESVVMLLCHSELFWRFATIPRVTDLGHRVWLPLGFSFLVVEDSACYSTLSVKTAEQWLSVSSGATWGLCEHVCAWAKWCACVYVCSTVHCAHRSQRWASGVLLNLCPPDILRNHLWLNLEITC